jgi:hypothetical protein
MKLRPLMCAGTRAASGIAAAQLITMSAAFAALAVLLVLTARAAAGAPGESTAAPRVEARSADLLAVGVVSADRMSIHVSRLSDNAPVRDASVTVLLRGVTHPAMAETDGGYAVQTGDLMLPGSAAVEFRIVGAAEQETLKGTLQIAGPAGASDSKNSARQMWWWVLNFAVCIGFLLLLSRRRKAADG